MAESATGVDTPGLPAQVLSGLNWYENTLGYSASHGFQAADAKRSTFAALCETTMDQFSRWSGIVHAALSQQHPKIRLGQIHQLLAACLGHRTYASLRTSDLETLNQHPSYVLFDHESGFARANELGILLTEAEWREAHMAIRPSGVTPFWLTDWFGMSGAARVTFEDSFDTRIHAIKRAIGFPDGHYATATRCQSAEGELPDILRFVVEGEVRAYNEDTRLAVPVVAELAFEKIGCQMYASGNLNTVEQSGPPREYEPEDDDYGDVYGP